MDDEDLSDGEPADLMDAGSDAGSLRFAVGDRVRCKTGARSWKKGEIVALLYREDHWPAGQVAPYQIQLDAGPLIYAPEDTDDLDHVDYRKKMYDNVVRSAFAATRACARTTFMANLS